jgi:hypothetical protein
MPRDESFSYGRIAVANLFVGRAPALNNGQGYPPHPVGALLKGLARVDRFDRSHPA